MAYALMPDVVVHSSPPCTGYIMEYKRTPLEGTVVQFDTSCYSFHSGIILDYFTRSSRYPACSSIITDFSCVFRSPSHVVLKCVMDLHIPRSRYRLGHYHFNFPAISYVYPAALPE